MGKNCFVILSSKINRTFQNALQKYADFVYNYPYIPILGALILFGALAYGFFLYQDAEDAIKNWVPQGAEALDDRDTVSKYFETQSLPTVIYLVAKNQGDNVITLDIYKAIKDFDSQFKQEVEEKGYKYNDICYKPKPESECDTKTHPLDFFLTSDGNYDLSEISSDSQLLSKIKSGKGDQDLYPEDSSDFIRIANMFGKTTPDDITTYDDGSNNIQSAKAIQWTYYFNGEDLGEDFYDVYDQKFEDFVDQFNKENDYIELYIWTSSGIFRAFGDSLDQDLTFIAIGIIQIILYSFIVLGKFYTYNSRILIAFVGIISVFLAYVEGRALASYMALDGNGLLNVIPFMLLGIGVDDMFVLLFALDQAPSDFSGKEKLKYMMKTAGVSITITSVTNVCTFGMGAITTIQGVKHFCIYACFGMLFDYVNQITLFVAILSLDIRRSEKKKGDCCGLLYCKPKSPFCCHGKLGMNPDGTPREPIAKKILREYYGPFLLKNPVRIAVLVFFTGFMAFNIYGATQLQLDWDIEWFVEDDFEVKDSLDIRDKYFGDSGWTIKYYTVQADFKSKEVQADLLELEELIQDCDGCGDDWYIEDTTQSWYPAFNNWIDNGNCQVSGSIVTLDNDNFVPQSEFYECLLDWEESDQGIKYILWLAWNDDNSVLRAAYMEVDTIKIEGADEQIDFMGDSRDIADKGPDQTFAYNPEYLWIEHKAVFQAETTISFSGSLVAAFIIILIMMADVLGAVFSIIMVGLTVVGQLSLLYWWNQHLNIITMIHTIMAIGISVDYSAHIAHAFKTAQGKDRKDRIIQAFDHVGVAVFNGGFSTLLAILPLAAATSYIYRTFFKCWFAIVVYGISHGLILLPVILSFVGAPPLEQEEENLGRNDNARENQNNLSTLNKGNENRVLPLNESNDASEIQAMMVEEIGN